MIPKTIHYCWFGRGKKPEKIVKCINSWKKHLSDYEFVEWNEDNFDITSNLFVKEAYESKKYAFVSDYVRLYALYNFGGIYMDTDVEVLKPLDRFLEHSAFSGFEDEKYVPTGIIGAEKGNLWIKDLLERYKNMSFIKKDGSFNMTTNTEYITESCLKAGLIQNGKQQTLKNGVTFYSRTYFCPYDYGTGENFISENTYTIHHFAKTWLPWHVRYRTKLKLFLFKIFGKQSMFIVIDLIKKH